MAVTALEAVDECPDGAEIVTGIPQKKSVGALAIEPLEASRRK